MDIFGNSNDNDLNLVEIKTQNQSATVGATNFSGSLTVNNVAVPSSVDVTALETKTQNQTATAGTTTFTGTITGASLIHNATKLTQTSPLIDLNGQITANNSIFPKITSGSSLGDSVLAWNNVYTVFMNVSNKILPFLANTTDIGSAVLPFKDIYATRITGLGAPGADTDAATKLYADGKATAPLTTVADTAVAVFNGTTGKTIKQSPVLISDAGVVSGVSSVTGNLLPTTNIASSLGATSQRFLNVYTDNILSSSSVNMNGVMTITPTTITTTGNMVFNTGTLAMNGSTVNILNTGATTINPTGALTLKAFDCSGVINMSANSKITNLGTPTLNTDAATKLYVDSAKPYIDLTPTTTPTLVEGRIYYDALVDNLVYAKNNNWYQITSSIYYPINSANLKGWFDASNPSSVSQSAGNVTVWNDVSGNGFNLTGITSTPRTGDTTFNSKNVVNLDGTEVIYRSTDTINYTTHTIWFIKYAKFKAG